MEIIITKKSKVILKSPKCKHSDSGINISSNTRVNIFKEIPVLFVYFLTRNYISWHFETNFGEFGLLLLFITLSQKISKREKKRGPACYVRLG